MPDELKKLVLEANLALPRYGLVTFTWGNASQIDREKGVLAIKPSGVEYEALTADDMVLVDVNSVQIVEGIYKPSSDTPTHLELYRRFPGIGGVVHTHSRWATVFAQAGRGIPVFGTTHADTFYGEIPCTRSLTFAEIKGDYETETGRMIAETLENNGIDPLAVPAVLVCNHGPFVFGRDAAQAAHNAAVLEEAAFMAYHTLSLNPSAQPISSALLDRHFLRKHGKDAYYGQ